jgi:hypothetical protein
MPVGGVRFPDAEYPLGKPTPVSLPPVTTTSIDNACGNRGVFQPFSNAELTNRYGSNEKYLALYDCAVKKLIREGFVLAEDEKSMLEDVGYLYDHAEHYLPERHSAAAR